jgi:UDP-GlcNAc:undecaprenyl-phosphate GlcNAc-1-phosphate transferase
MSELSLLRAGFVALVALLTNFIVICAVVRCRVKIAEKTRLFDDSAKKAHSRHQGKIPLVGGLAFTLAFLSVISVSFITKVVLTGGPINAMTDLDLIAYLLFIALFFVLGIVDDMYGLSARTRLAWSSIFVTFLMLFTGDKFLINALSDVSLGLVLPLGPYAFGATGVAIIALVNAFNMSDGRNGIVAGTVAIWSLSLALKANDIVIAGILGLCLINSLVLGGYNLKNKLFFGDAGAYAIAAIFGGGVLAWHSHGIAGERLTSLEVCSLFLIQILDMIRLITVRTRAGASPMAADHNHLHHRLDDHFGWPAGLSIYLALVAVPVGISFQEFPSSGVLGVGFGICFYIAIIFLTRSQQSRNPSGVVEPL